VAETEKRSLSSADFPAGSVEEHWIKEIGKMFEVRLEQLRANLTDELLLLLTKPISLKAQLWPGRCDVVDLTQTEPNELSSDASKYQRQCQDAPGNGPRAIVLHSRFSRVLRRSSNYLLRSLRQLLQ
jgi:hypothetical protein